MSKIRVSINKPLFVMALLLLTACTTTKNITSGNSISCPPQWFGQRSTEPNIMFAYGQGNTILQARTAAEAMLSRQLKSTINTRCDDIVSSITKNNASQTGRVNSQSVCQTHTQSRLHLTHSTITHQRQCHGQTYLRIDLDQRPITKRLALDTLKLSPPEQQIIKQNRKLPYTVFTRKHQANSHTHYDSAYADYNHTTQLWTLSTEHKSTTITTESYLKDVEWQGCEGARERLFQLTSKGHTIERIEVNKTLDITINVPKGAHYLSLINIVGKQGIKVLNKTPVPLSNLPKRFSLQLLPTLLRGQVTSHEIYLSLFTTNPIKFTRSADYMDAGSALKALLKTLLSHNVTAHCAQELNIYLPL